MKKLSRKTHGIIDYLSVLFMIAAPWLFGFISNTTAASCFFIAAALVLVISLYTNYELGLKKNIPMSFHLDMDIVLGVFLSTSPWLFDFSQQVFWPHVLMGMFAIMAGLTTQTNSLKTNVHAMNK